LQVGEEILAGHRFPHRHLANSAGRGLKRIAFESAGALNGSSILELNKRQGLPSSCDPSTSGGALSANVRKVHQSRYLPTLTGLATAISEDECDEAVTAFTRGLQIVGTAKNAGFRLQWKNHRG
jgi:hypothetical protein